MVAAFALFSFLTICLVGPSLGALDKRYLVEREGVTYNVFEHGGTGSRLEFVKNSGICETTPGVNQYSGYLSVGEDMNMWFWFFEARHEPATAPLVAWFNGGPGSSSMNALFVTHGPCQFYNGSDVPSLNPHSWNEYANMIYIDQPIGVGFSYGAACCDSTDTAAIYVWNLIQAFYDSFPEYESRDFGIFAQSYGGRYAPVFANHIIEQNAGIAAGAVDGSAINLVALGTNDGIYNMTEWYVGLIEYSYSNPYRPLLAGDDELYAACYDYYDSACLPALEACYATDDDAACYAADTTCKRLLTTIQDAIDDDDFETYDIRPGAVLPPSTYQAYLAREDIQAAIGARVNFTSLNFDVYTNMTTSGDWVRPSTAFTPAVLEAGVRVLMWTGDADWICSWEANSREADAVVWPGQAEFRAKPLAPYTVDGAEKGALKTVGNFSYMRAYEAGHDLAYYQPELALQVFKQMMTGGLEST
ncbi:putative carboxypeptidase S1 [Xylariomycetidae sp. FL2044]|nr:putative carboxypeptidase S1 [Xylariomycetidae sp. FL2044]